VTVPRPGLTGAPHPRLHWLPIGIVLVPPIVLGLVALGLLPVMGDTAGPLLRGLAGQGALALALVPASAGIVALARRLPLTGMGLAPRVALHLALGSLVALGASVASGEAMRWLDPAHPLAQPWRDLLQSPLGGVRFGYAFAVYLVVLGWTRAVQLATAERERAVEAAALRAGLAEAELRALRSQLEPHFLFNALNGISALVGQDPARARQMLVRLSELLRLALERRDAALQPLARDLDFAARYLELQQLRFGDRLAVRLQADAEARRAEVPSLLLQPLVENAIRHGIQRRAAAGLVEVAAWREGDELVVRVRDDGPGPGAGPSPAANTGLGLGATRERLAARYGARARLELRDAPGGGGEATVRLPYRDTGEEGERG